MSDRYVIEAWLRPAVELNSALVSGGAAFVCAVAPWAVALSPSVSYVTAGAFAGFSALRAHQGFRVRVRPQQHAGDVQDNHGRAEGPAGPGLRDGFGAHAHRVGLALAQVPVQVVALAASVSGKRVSVAAETHAAPAGNPAPGSGAVCSAAGTLPAGPAV